jgi:hypothetical protein
VKRDGDDEGCVTWDMNFKMDRNGSRNVAL